MSSQAEIVAERPRTDYRDRYPRGAVDAAVEALELAYSYIRDTGKPGVEQALDEALRLLRRAQSPNVPLPPQ